MTSRASSSETGPISAIGRSCCSTRSTPLGLAQHHRRDRREPIEPLAPRRRAPATRPAGRRSAARTRAGGRGSCRSRSMRARLRRVGILAALGVALQPHLVAPARSAAGASAPDRRRSPPTRRSASPTSTARAACLRRWHRRRRSGWSADRRSRGRRRGHRPASACDVRAIATSDLQPSISSRRAPRRPARRTRRHARRFVQPRHLRERQVLGEAPRGQVLARRRRGSRGTRGRPDAGGACRDRTTRARSRARPAARGGARARAGRRSDPARARTPPSRRTARRGALPGGCGARSRRIRVLRPAPKRSARRRPARAPAAASARRGSAAARRGRCRRSARAARARSPSDLRRSMVAMSPKGTVTRIEARGARCEARAARSALRDELELHGRVDRDVEQQQAGWKLEAGELEAGSRKPGSRKLRAATGRQRPRRRVEERGAIGGAGVGELLVEPLEQDGEVGAAQRQLTRAARRRRPRAAAPAACARARAGSRASSRPGRSTAAPRRAARRTWRAPPPLRTRDRSPERAPAPPGSAPRAAAASWVRLKR